MTAATTKKLWSQQTIEERVRTALRAERMFIERIDPDDQALTQDNYKNNIGLYVLVDEHRQFIRVLENILEKTTAEPVQMHPSQFAELIKGKETMIGVPVYWSEWPTKERSNDHTT